MISMINTFLNELKINGKSKKTIILNTSILKNANIFKPLESWTKDDVNNYILYLQNEKYKESSIEIHKLIIRKFFNWAKKEEIVKHLEIRYIKSNLKREEILSTEEINNMIETTPSPMYKAYIALLFESGAREGEILKLKVKDTNETDQGLIISVNDSKTGKGFRRSIYIFSAQYIRNHITYANLSKDNLIFPISHTQSWRMLKKIGKKAGIEKPISAHKFRHAQATDMVLRGYQETIIRKKLGWTDDSKMIARYTHIIDEDVINATLEKNGSSAPKQTIINIKTAESLKIADASLQLKKLSDENEEIKHQYNDTSLQLKKLSENFEDLKKQMFGTASILGAIQKGIIKPNEINSITEIETSKDTEEIKIRLDNSTNSSKMIDRINNLKKESQD